MAGRILSHLSVLLLFFVGCSHADNVTDTSGLTTDGTTPTTLQTALRPVYIMTNYFLEKMLLKENTLASDYASKLVDGGGDILTMLQSEYQAILSTYAGYAACIVAGLLYFLLMPIIGLIVCCCRTCCKKCGGGIKPRENKRARCTRIVCGLLLFLSTTVMLLAAVALFLTNDELHSELAGENSFVSDLDDNIEGFQKYISIDIDQAVKKNINDKVKAVKDDIVRKLDNVAETTKNQLGNETNISGIINKAKQLADGITNIKADLDKVNDSTTILKNTGQQLSQNLTDLKKEINATVQSCIKVNDDAESACRPIGAELGKLETKADFTKVDDVQKQMGNFRNILNANFSELIADGEKEFKKITEKIQNESQSRVDDFKKEAESIVTNTDNSTEKLLKQIYSIEDELNNIRRVLDKDVKPIVKEAADYWRYGFIGIAGMVCLILLLYYLGLVSGAMGDPPSVPNSCNRGIGANILVAAVVLTFLFVWIFMLIVLLTFTIFGWLGNNEVCHPLTTYINDPSSGKIKNILEVVESELTSTDNNISISSIVSDCKNDEPIFKVIEKFLDIDIDGLVSLENLGLLDEVENLINKTNIDVSGVEVLSNDTRKQLDSTLNSDLDKINFTSFSTELSKSFTEVNLDEFKESLMNISREIKQKLQANDNGISEAFKQHADRVGLIEMTTIKEMENDKNVLEKSIKDLEETALGKAGQKNLTTQTKELIQAFEDAQDTLTNNGSRIIKQIITKEANSMLSNVNKTLDDITKFIKNDLGKCRPVYNTLQSTLNIFCVNILNPINGIWFCLGACLFFFIPNIIIALKLVSLYRKTEPYKPEEPFDKGDYELYSRNASHKRKRKHDDDDDQSEHDQRPYRDENRRNNHRAQNVDKPRRQNSRERNVNGNIRPEKRYDYYDDQKSYPAPQQRNPYEQNYPPPYGQNGYHGNNYANRSYEDYTRNASRPNYHDGVAYGRNPGYGDPHNPGGYNGGYRY